MAAAPVMSFTPASYDHRAVDAMSDIDVSAKRFASINGYDTMKSFIRDLFMEFGLQDTFGVGLLHRHYDLSPDEKIVRLGPVSSPWVVGNNEEITGGSIVPHTWRVHDGQLKPTEFEFVPKHAFPNYKFPDFPVLFVEKVIQILQETGLDDILGITLLEGNDDDNNMELTYGRSSISIPPVEMQGNMIVGPNQFEGFQAQWRFTEKDEDVKVAHFSCGKAAAVDGVQSAHFSCSKAAVDGVQSAHFSCSKAAVDGVKSAHFSCGKAAAVDGVQSAHFSCSKAAAIDGVQSAHFSCSKAAVDGVKSAHFSCSKAAVDGVQSAHFSCSKAAVDGVKSAHFSCSKAAVDGVQSAHFSCSKAAVDGVKSAHFSCGKAAAVDGVQSAHFSCSKAAANGVKSAHFSCSKAAANGVKSAHFSCGKSSINKYEI